MQTFLDAIRESEAQALGGFGVAVAAALIAASFFLLPSAERGRIKAPLWMLIAHVALVLRPRQTRIRAICIDNAAVVVGDEQAFAHRIHEGLRQGVGLPAPGKAQQADCSGKQRKHTDDREDAKQTEYERFSRLRLDDREGKRRPHESKCQQEQTPDAGQPF